MTLRCPSKPRGVTVRSRTAEFLTFPRHADEQSLLIRAEDESTWLTQKPTAELFAVDVRTVNEHLKNIIASGDREQQAVVRKFRITASDGKNYLTQDELQALDCIVNADLDQAEDRALRRLPMTMEDWARHLDRFLELTDRGNLLDAGRISAGAAKLHAESEFERFRVTQDRQFESDFDRVVQAGKALVKPAASLDGKGRGNKG